MLTHYNIASNIEQMGQTFMFDSKDSLLGVLPFFHSFGFTVTLWLPAVLGVSRGLSSEPARSHRDQRTRARLSRDVPDGHADVLAGVHAALLARRFRQPAISSSSARKNCPSAWRSLSKTASA